MLTTDGRMKGQQYIIIRPVNANKSIQTIKNLLTKTQNRCGRVKQIPTTTKKEVQI